MFMPGIDRTATVIELKTAEGMYDQAMVTMEGIKYAKIDVGVEMIKQMLNRMSIETSKMI